MEINLDLKIKIADSVPNDEVLVFAREFNRVISDLATKYDDYFKHVSTGSPVTIVTDNNTPDVYDVLYEMMEYSEHHPRCDLLTKESESCTCGRNDNFERAKLFIRQYAE